jgi:hypothetical protein
LDVGPAQEVAMRLGEEVVEITLAAESHSSEAVSQGLFLDMTMVIHQQLTDEEPDGRLICDAVRGHAAGHELPGGMARKPSSSGNSALMCPGGTKRVSEPAALPMTAPYSAPRAR